jgi:predicted ATP-dependent serine protease
MAKTQKTFVCGNCGSSYRKWQGKCEDCGEWNTIEEEAAAVSGAPKGLSGKKGATVNRSRHREIDNIIAGARQTRSKRRRLCVFLW